MTQQLSTGLVPEWTVGDRLRKAREVAGLEAQQLAEEIDVHRDTIANYEKGRVRPRVIVLKAWAMRTGVSLNWLQNGGVPPHPEVVAPSSARHISGGRAGATQNGPHPEGEGRELCAIRDLNPEPAD